MRHFFLFVFIFFLLKNNLAQNNVHYKNYNGIKIEKSYINSEIKENRFAKAMYKSHIKYYWSYTYKKSDSLYRYEGVHRHDYKRWKLTPIIAENNQIELSFYMEILSEWPKVKGFVSDTTQKCLHYVFIDTLKRPFPVQSYTGLIENERNIWFHPPRTFLFKILELNPFPYVKFPMKKGRRWSWKLVIGEHYGDERWVTWTGSILNRCQYKVVDTEYLLNTPFGVIPCYVIEAMAHSRIGKTKVVYYYNSSYGFVRSEHTNIDGSILNLQLQKIEHQ